MIGKAIVVLATRLAWPGGHVASCHGTTMYRGIATALNLYRKQVACEAGQKPAKQAVGFRSKPGAYDLSPSSRPGAAKPELAKEAAARLNGGLARAPLVVFINTNPGT